MNLAGLLVCVIALAGCGGGGGGGEDDGSNPPPPGPPPEPPALVDQIPIVRAQCTPFGAPPRPLEAAVPNPACQPGEQLEDWIDPDGTVRRACLYAPAERAAGTQLPLVIFLHPSIVGPGASLAGSNILSQIETADLSGDPARPGFVLLAPVGRPTDRFFFDGDDTPALGWDNTYRQLVPSGGSRQVNGQEWAQNVDAAAIDHFLDEVLARGHVDPERIYVMGWSNGGAMGLLYALNRPAVAAAAVYSAPNPFGDFNDPCRQAPVTDAPVNDTQIQILSPGTPLYHVNNACDIIGICPNGLALQNSLLQNGVSVLENQIINEVSGPVLACAAECGSAPLANYSASGNPGGYRDEQALRRAARNHIRFPLAWTDDMFAFLRQHPRSVPR